MSRARLGPWLLALPLLACAPRHALAQESGGGQVSDTLVIRALELEVSQPREAIALYRRAFEGEAMVPALLGLERVYNDLQQLDSLLPLARRAVRLQPRATAVRTVELRTLAALHQDEELRLAFRDWIRAVPGEAAPFKEYAALLLQMGRSTGADSVLVMAQRYVRDPRDFSTELAQVATAQKQWPEAARRWRIALAREPQYAVSAAVALQGVPLALRDTVRAVFGVLPASLAVRTALARLELGWGAARAGWEVLSQAPADEAAATAWREFADEAEAGGAWLVARDAFTALHRARRSAEDALRAAQAALVGGDAAGALPLADEAATLVTPAIATRDVVPVRLRALAALGRAPAVAALVDSVSRAAGTSPALQAVLSRHVMWAWLRVGAAAQARPLVATADDDDAAALLAVYDGDLSAARTALRGADASNLLLLSPRAVLARSTAARAPVLGEAFTQLARGDSAAAASAFARAAAEVPDAAPLVLALSARIEMARGRDAVAVPLWTRIVSEYATAPEAAEADLEWARAALRANDAATAVTRLEHLLVTYPRSALAAQARLVLDEARRRTASS